MPVRPPGTESPTANRTPVRRNSRKGRRTRSVCSAPGMPLARIEPGSVSAVVASATSLPLEISATTTCTSYSLPADSASGENDQLTGCEDSGRPGIGTWPSRTRSSPWKSRKFSLATTGALSPPRARTRTTTRDRYEISLVKLWPKDSPAANGPIVMRLTGSAPEAGCCQVVKPKMSDARITSATPTRRGARVRTKTGFNLGLRSLNRWQEVILAKGCRGRPETAAGNG